MQALTENREVKTNAWQVHQTEAGRIGDPIACEGKGRRWRLEGK